VEPAWTKREYDQSNPPQPRKAYDESIPLLLATKSFRALVPPRCFPHRHLYASDTRWEASSEEARRAPSLGSSGGSALPVACGAASSPRCPGENMVVRAPQRALGHPQRPKSSTSSEAAHRPPTSSEAAQRFQLLWFWNQQILRSLLRSSSHWSFLWILYATLTGKYL
jgi:hypothetical protein